MNPTRILLVDDDDQLREAARFVLSERGFDVVEAREGDEAIRKYRAQAADVVVCDLFMPGKDGLQTIRELRAEFPEIRIIAVSGGGFHGTLDMLNVARVLGAAEVIAKPYKIEHLVNAIERASVR